MASGPSGGLRLLVIRNPAAGQRRARHYAKALRMLEKAGCRVTVAETKERGDAVKFAREADESAYDAVVAAGGDGTINESVNGLAGRSLPLGIIPLGTSNVLAHEIGVGSDIAHAVEAILHGRPQAVAAADAGGHLCCLMVSAGYDARAITRVRPFLKRLTGEGAYYIAGLGELLAGSARLFSVEADGERYRAAAVIAMNGRLYGGKFVCAPDADMRKPQLHVVLLNRTGRWNVLRYGMALVTNRLYRLADVRIVPALRLRILGPAGEPLQSDGDLIGETPIDITIRENAVEILYPPDRG
jgi:YegS/Rv2252/BmrU family lipid kinase